MSPWTLTSSVTRRAVLQPHSRRHPGAGIDRLPEAVGADGGGKLLFLCDQLVDLSAIGAAQLPEVVPDLKEAD